MLRLSTAGWLVGLENAALVVDGGESMLVDTLFDLKLTRAMLETMRRAEPKATAALGRSSTLIPMATMYLATNSSLALRSSASKACAEEMIQDQGAKRLADFKNNAASMGEAGRFFAEIFAPFDFDGITVAMPMRHLRRHPRLLSRSQTGTPDPGGSGAYSRRCARLCARIPCHLHRRHPLYQGHPIIWAAGRQLDQGLPADDRPRS